MNILFLTYGLPSPPDRGARIRDFHFIKNISRNNNVYLLSLLELTGQEANIAELSTYCCRIDFVEIHRRSAFDHLRAIWENIIHRRPLAVHDYYHVAITEKLIEMVTNEEIDIIQIEHSFFAPYVVDLPEDQDFKTILDFHNLGFQQYERMVDLSSGVFEKIKSIIKSSLMRNWEMRYASLFDHCLATSINDAELLKENDNGLPVTVVPNGVDADSHQLLNNSQDENTLLMVGTIGYAPNEDAVLYYGREILPLIKQQIPDVKLLVVGHAPSNRIIKFGLEHNIEVLGSVPDILPYYERASVAIVPLRAGGGTRLKILEAMAFGVPVVTTSIGSEGLNVVHGEQLLIADSASEFADCVVRLLKDHKIRKQLIQNARQKIAREYDWKHICKSLQELYEKINT